MSKLLDIGIRVKAIKISRILKRNFSCGSSPFPGITKEALVKLHAAYANLLESKSCCMLKKYLDPKAFHKLQQIKTPTYSSNLLDCIQCGLKYHDCRIGVYAADAECYKIFNRLFDPIIEELHNYKNTDKHPPLKFGTPSKFTNIDPRMDFILSTRMRIVRNVNFYPFAPKMTKVHYKRLEDEIVPTLIDFQDDHQGWYFPQEYTLRSFQNNWIEQHLYKDPDRFMEAGKICRCLPVGRGFFHNLDRTFSVWLNYEDHLRVVSMQQGGAFGEVYQRLVDAMRAFNRLHDFARNNHLGYLTCSPENLGTGLRCSVLMKLAKLPTNREMFLEVLNTHNLQVRGTYGRGTPVKQGLYDISNKRTLGISEYDCVRTVYKGVKDIIKLEKCIKTKCVCKSSIKMAI